MNIIPKTLISFLTIISLMALPLTVISANGDFDPPDRYRDTPPDVPDKPDTPDVPDKPDTPDVPDKPEKETVQEHIDHLSEWADLFEKQGNDYNAKEFREIAADIKRNITDPAKAAYIAQELRKGDYDKAKKLANP